MEAKENLVGSLQNNKIMNAFTGKINSALARLPNKKNMDNLETFNEKLAIMDDFVSVVVDKLDLF